MHTDTSKEIREIISTLPDAAKQEAYDYLEFLYSKYVKNNKSNKVKAFEIINNYQGRVENWTRDQLHER